MKTLDLAEDGQDVRELLELAAEQNLILRTCDGRQFVLAEIDDFESELRLVREQSELMALLAKRSSASGTFTLEQVKKELNLG